MVLNLRAPQRTPPIDPHARFLYTILKQLDLKSIDWSTVAEQLDITNGHAARMRFSRFRGQMEGRQTPARAPRKVAGGKARTDDKNHIKEEAAVNTSGKKRSAFEVTKEDESEDSEPKPTKIKLEPGKSIENSAEISIPIKEESHSIHDVTCTDRPHDQVEVGIKIRDGRSEEQLIKEEVDIKAEPGPEISG